MKLEQSEFFLIEELFKQSQKKGIFSESKLEEIDKLTGDASTRRYYRLYTNDQSLVVCLDNPFAESENEHPFLSVQKFLFNSHVPVPKIFDHNLDRGYILQEDLGDSTLLTILSEIKNPHQEREIYLKIINHLISLHRIEKSQILDSSLFKNSFDFEKLMSEVKFTFKYFIQIFLKLNDEDKIQELEREFIPIIERISSSKMVITHRDFHSRNIMIKKDSFYFIDFQDARWGLPQYDLVSLIEDCYYDLDAENREFLKRYYYDQMCNLCGLGDFDNFSELYDDMAIQRVFKAVGSFCYIYNWRKDERYLKYIGFGMEKIRKIMMKNPKYLKLKNLLFKIYYAN